MVDSFESPKPAGTVSPMKLARTGRSGLVSCHLCMWNGPWRFACLVSVSRLDSSFLKHTRERGLLILEKGYWRPETSTQSPNSFADPAVWCAHPEHRTEPPSARSARKFIFDELQPFAKKCLFSFVSFSEHKIIGSSLHSHTQNNTLERRLCYLFNSVGS